MKIVFGSIFVSMLFTSSIIFAQDVRTTDTVIISALRVKQIKKALPYSSSIFNLSKEEKTGVRTIPEALSNTSGVFIQKTNHAGGSAFIRGLTGNQNLILIDGIRLNNSTFRYGPNQYLNTIDYYSVGKVEVLKGNGSVQYGSDALSGVIQLFSKEIELGAIKPKFGANAALKSVSQQMENSLHTEISYSSKKIATIVGFTARKFGDLYGGDTTGKQGPSGYNEKSYFLNTKIALSSTSNISFGSRGMFQHDVPFFYKMQLENYKTNQINLQSHQLNYIKFSKITNQKLLQTINASVSYQHSVEDKETQKNSSAVLTTEINKVNTLGMSIEATSLINAHWKANSGIELYHDRVNSSKNDLNTSTVVNTEKRGLYPDGSTYQSISAFSLHEFHFKQHRFQAGLRYNTFDIKIEDTTLGRVVIKPSAMVYNLAYILRLNKNNNIYSNVSSAYRAPNIDDMGTLGIVDFRYEVPSQSLKPEKSINTEIGHRYQSQRLESEFAIFYIRLYDIITRSKVAGEKINGYDVYSKNNSESAFIRGFEHTLKVAVTKTVTIQNNFSYTYGQNISLNEPLRRIPPFHGMTKVSFEKEKFYLNAIAQYAGEQTRLSSGDKSDNRMNKYGTASWTILNINTGYEFKHIEINTGIQNLFNKDYRTHGSGINGMGRSLWLSVKVKV
jgi:hemoglobin/transferrin/lactoferrin receptor protein